MHLKKLLEERAAAVAGLQAILEAAESESRAFSEEEQSKFDELEGQVKSLQERIERAKKVEELAASAAVVIETGEGEAGKEDRTGHKAPAAEPFNDGEYQRMTERAMGGWLQSNGGHQVRRENMTACERVGLDPRGNAMTFYLRGAIDCSDYERRVQTSELGTEGGFLASETFSGTVDEAMLATGGLRAAGAETIRTSNGNDIVWPGLDDTANRGRLLSQRDSANEQDLVFSEQRWRAHEYTSEGIRVHRSLLADAGVDVQGIVARMLGTRIGRITNEHFATGDGSGKPEGIEAGSVLGVTAASTTGFAADELEDLIESIDPAYRSNFRFLSHSAIQSSMSKLKDGTGMYLFRGPNDGRATRVFGYDWFLDQELDSTFASGNISVIGGDLSFYKIRDVAQMTLFRSEHRYAEFNQIGFWGFSRHDGKTLNSGGDPIKHLIH